MNKKTTLSLIIGTLLSCIALYFAFKNVPFSNLINTLSSINYFWIIPSTIVAALTFVLRGQRWQIILNTNYNLPFWHAFNPLIIGFMINCILPARIGEVARPAILMKKDNVPFSFGLATVAAERVFDLILLITIFAVVLSTVQIDPALEITFGKYTLTKATLEAIFGGMIKLCLLMVTVIILISIKKVKAFINQCIMKLPSLFFFLPDSLNKKIEQTILLRIVHIIDNIAAGFSLMKNPKKICLCLALSFLIWILSVLAYYLIALGCPGIQLSFSEIAVYMIIICFFIALPSVPGYWGLWEAGGIFAMTLFGVPQDDALGYTLVAHFFQIAPVIIIGLAAAIFTGVNIRQIQQESVIT